MQQIIPTEIIVDLGHIQVAAQRWGDPGLAPVLALHGWLDNAASYQRLAPLLKECCVVAIDMPGHGLSGFIPEGMTYHLTDGITNVVRVLDALRWQRATLLGHSMGAAIASLVAGSFPERVEKLIMLDAIGPLSEAIAKGPERLGRAVGKIIAAGKKQRTIYPSIEQMAKYRAETGGISIESATMLVERGAHAVDGGYSWRFDPRLLLPSLTYFSEDQVAVFLKNIIAPSLLLTGSNGLMIDNTLLDQRIAKVNNIVHTSIDGHHHLHMDSCQAVATAINQFLA